MTAKTEKPFDARKYQDSDGNDCTLDQMVRREPDWAANRIRVGEQQSAEIARLRDVAQGLLNEIDQNTCMHEDTHRAGFIWTICDQCGRKWADDEGGFKQHVDSPIVEAAREALSAQVEKS